MATINSYLGSCLYESAAFLAERLVASFPSEVSALNVQGHVAVQHCLQHFTATMLAGAVCCWQLKGVVSCHCLMMVLCCILQHCCTYLLLRCWLHCCMRSTMYSCWQHAIGIAIKHTGPTICSKVRALPDFSPKNTEHLVCTASQLTLTSDRLPAQQIHGILALWGIRHETTTVQPQNYQPRLSCRTPDK